MITAPKNPYIYDVIMDAGVRERIRIGDNKESVEFDVYVEGNAVLFSWTVREKAFGYVFPMMSDQKTIKYFKTLSGAKRNFLRQYKITKGEQENDT